MFNNPFFCYVQLLCHGLRKLFRSSSLYVLDYLARIADSDAVGGDVARDNGTGADSAVIAYRHTGQDGHVAANPHAVAYRHGFRPLLASSAFTRIGTMTRAVDMHARS